MLTAGFANIEPLLERALRDHAGEEEWEETAIAALGLAEAARVLGATYHLVCTNVPYLATAASNQKRFESFAENRYPESKNDLGTVFLERCQELTHDLNVGVIQIVTPQNWFFLTQYQSLRMHLLKTLSWDLIARLGTRAFDSIGGEVVNVMPINARPCENQ